MLDLNVVNGEMVASRKYFLAVSPGPFALLGGRMKMVGKVAGLTWGYHKKLRDWRKGKPVATITGELLGGKITGFAMKPVSTQIRKTHIKINRMPQRDMFRKNGIGGRTWISETGQYPVVMIFHDANRVGPHIDIHIGRMSVIYRVKPETYAQLKYNRDGYLTENSKQLLINHVRAEIANGSRLPQNLDHSLTNARAQWTNGDPEGKSYGDGRTRQIVLETTADIYKAHEDGPIEMYLPEFNSHRALYMYRLYPGDGKRAPILIWGAKTNQPPKLEDRLHLKLIHPEDVPNLGDKVDWSTSTAKYDGSSCYFVIDKNGTHVYSPRKSAATGEQIDYTFKMDGLARVTSEQTIIGMGEVLFREKSRIPFKKGKYIPQAQGSGILNSNKVLPSNIEPEIRIYRIDKVGRENTVDQDFWTNRELQENVAKLDPKHLAVVELMTPEEALEAGFEGFVVASPGKGVNEAFKTKWWEDANDWRIDKIAFEIGEKGGMAGVVYLTSLESGKQFKLGPGGIGDRELFEDMMNNPGDWEGTVLKVQSRPGHEGRAAKAVAIHQDKGLSPVYEADMAQV